MIRFQREQVWFFFEVGTCSTLMLSGGSFGCIWFSSELSWQLSPARGHQNHNANIMVMRIKQVEYNGVKFGLTFSSVLELGSFGWSVTTFSFPTSLRNSSASRMCWVSKHLTEWEHQLKSPPPHAFGYFIEKCHSIKMTEV